jgi:hypothetical protein
MKSLQTALEFEYRTDERPISNVEVTRTKFGNLNQMPGVPLLRCWKLEIGRWSFCIFWYSSLGGLASLIEMQLMCVQRQLHNKARALPSSKVENRALRHGNVNVDTYQLRNWPANDSCTANFEFGNWKLDIRYSVFSGAPPWKRGIIN